MQINSSLQWSVNAYIQPFVSEFFNSSTITTFMEVENDCRFRPSTENYLTIISFCIIFFLSVIGNSIVVVVILQQRTMRSITNIYLLNLAISDLMLSVICMPPTLVSSVIYCWMFGDLLCKLFAYLQPVVVTASAYTLAVIAFERYYAICRPLHSRIWQTRSHAYAMIILVWMISIFANFFMLFMFELQTYNINGLTCAPRFQPIIHFGYQIYMTSVLLFIPLFLMVILYGSVIHSLKIGMKMDIAAVEGSINDIDDEEEDDDRVDHIAVKSPKSDKWKKFQPTKKKSSKRSKNDNRDKEKRSLNKAYLSMITNTSNSSNAINQQINQLRSTHSEKAIIAKQRVIRMLIVIVIIFFCCWTPNYMWWLLLTAQDSFKTFDVWNSQLNTAITVLCYISSCANPITYCFLNKKFRTALLISFGCRKNCNHLQRIKLHKANGTSQSSVPININEQLIPSKFKTNTNKKYMNGTKRDKTVNKMNNKISI